MDPQPEGPAPYPSLPPGSISFSEWHDLKRKYREWGNKRKHHPIEKFYDPEWSPGILSEREIPERISYIMERYHEYVSDKRILLHQSSDPTNHIAKPYMARGTDQYEQKIKRRLRDIRRDWLQRPGHRRATMITIAPRAVGSVLGLHRQIKALWPKLTDWLRHRFEYNTSIWAAEPTKRHYTHYHLVISGWHSEGLMAQEILHWLKSHGVDIENPGVEVKKCDRDPVWYATKYITKGSRDLFWQGMLWMGGGRIWGASRGLGNSPMTKSEEKWTYCGVCDAKWFEKYRESLVWGDVLPDRFISDLRRDKYMTPFELYTPSWTYIC